MNTLPKRAPLGLIPSRSNINTSTAMTCPEEEKEDKKAVKAQNEMLPFPDRIITAGSATLGEKQREILKQKDIKQQQKQKIIKAVCALLNSGGGIVVVNIENECYNFTKHSLGLDIDQSLRELFANSTTLDYIDILAYGSHLYMFVKAWTIEKGLPGISCVHSGLFIKSCASKTMANSMQVVNLIGKKTSPKRARLSGSMPSKSELLGDLLKEEYLHLNEELMFSESQYIEFKDFSGAQWQARIREAIKAYSSAFGNSDGGCLIIGVDDKRRVKGCCAETKESEVKSIVEKCVKKENCFHLEGCSSDEDISYELIFKNVLDHQQKPSGYVIILIIQPFCCLVFANSPESWKIESELYTCDVMDLEQLKTTEWIKKMSPKCEEMQSLTSGYARLSISDSTPITQPVYTKEGDESIDTVRKELFRVIAGKVNITPEHLYDDLCKEQPELKDIIEKWIQNKEGLLILSRSWAVDIGLTRNSNVVCEALLICTKTYPKLYVVFNKVISQKEFGYSRSTAITLKEKLVISGGYTGKLCIIPEAVSLEKENNQPSFFWPEMAYPGKYKLLCVEDLLDSLVIVLLQFKSFLSDRAGMEIFHLLTIEQYKLLSRKLLDSRHLFVHGLPGSGKTVLAVELMKKIKNMFNCETKDILYICENQPLKEYIWKLNICVSVTRKAFLNNDFDQIKHIIVDEAQNFQNEENGEDWYQKAKKIFKNAGDSSIFWVFLDYFQKSHTFPTGLPSIWDQNKETLTKIIRNGTKIHHFMVEPLKQICSSDSSNAAFLQNLLSESKCSHIEGFCTEHSLDESEIIKYVANKCKSYLGKGYSPQDIAILCNTADDVPHYKEKLSPMLKKHRLHLSDASAVNQNVAIIDSVRRFSGLERCIVFVIHPVPVTPSIKDNLLVCAASRAIIQLHVLYKKKLFEEAVGKKILRFFY